MATNYLARDYVLYLGTTEPTQAAEANDANYNKVGLLTSVSINQSRNTIDKSNKDDGVNSTFLVGRRSATVSGSAIFDHTADVGQAEIQAAIEASNGTVYWLITSVAAGDEEFYGNGVVTQYNVTFADEAPSTVDFEIQVSGTITQATGTTS